MGGRVLLPFFSFTKSNLIMLSKFIKKPTYFNWVITVIVITTFWSCKSKNQNYIPYYNKVNEIDSVYRFQRDTLMVIKEYKKLFRKYTPKNQERIDEFETYIKLSDKFGKNFGKRKSLLKLIPMVAPWWKYKRQESDFIGLYKKHGIDSLKIESEINHWKKNLNRKLVDSFSIAFIRDQEQGRDNTVLRELNDRKNEKLLRWTFENYGFPTLQKIGLLGNEDVIMSMGTLFLHMTDAQDYEYLKKKLLEYVISGDLPPMDYAGIVDRHNLQVSREKILYGYYLGASELKLDTLEINRNRKTIGMPSMKHGIKITKDFFKKK
jgi:hypothetical protein